MNQDTQETDAPRRGIPLKGEVCEQYVRCGKPGCRCESGSLHGPYYYRVWREGDQVKKVYVKQKDLEQIRQDCDSYRELSEQIRNFRRLREDLTRSLEVEWRKTKKLIREAS